MISNNAIWLAIIIAIAVCLCVDRICQAWMWQYRDEDDLP